MMYKLVIVNIDEKTGETISQQDAGLSLTTILGKEILRFEKAREVFDQESYEDFVKEVDNLSLKNVFDEVLERIGLPPDERERLSLQFARRVEEVRQCSTEEQALELPDQPPELWVSGQGERAIDFLWRVYRPYLEARILTYTWLREKDPKLASTISAAASAVSDWPPERLPVTRSEAVDIEREKLIKEVGEETFNRIIRLHSSILRRGSRASQVVSPGATGVEND